MPSVGQLMRAIDRKTRKPKDPLRFTVRQYAKLNKTRATERLEASLDAFFKKAKAKKKET